MRKIREHGGLECRHDGTVEIAAAESEPPEDRDIDCTKSPTPALETFTVPTPLTPSHSDTTSPASTSSVPYCITNHYPPYQIAAGGSQGTSPHR